jgi:HEAT repeat protein
MVDEQETRTQRLIRRLKARDFLVRLHAGLALCGLGREAREAVPTVIELLQADGVSDRKMAAWTLGYIGPGVAEAVAALRHALQDADPGVRMRAAEALAKIDPPGPRAAA